MTARVKATTIEVADGGTTLAVQRDARTDLYNTFRVGGLADYLVRAGTVEEIRLALRWAREQGLPVTVFGGGSNLLVGDRGVRGLVLVVRRPGKAAEAGLEVLAEDDAQALVRVPAAAPTNWLGHTAARRGWRGLAWAVGLPGNVGGAVVNNAGAHGGEVKDSLVSLRAIALSGELVDLERDWLEPRYRWTRLKAQRQQKGLVVLDATFRFERGPTEKLVAEAKEYATYRDRTQPTGACAGSIFKNPPGDYSGRVVEAAGLKGRSVGGAVVSPIHANFIVNSGGATAADIVALMRVVQDEVRRAFGVELEPEIERVGDWSDT
jgi:UDP-N-acetylmuramate dehydrogenase